MRLEMRRVAEIKRELALIAERLGKQRKFVEFGKSLKHILKNHILFEIKSVVQF